MSAIISSTSFNLSVFLTRFPGFYENEIYLMDQTDDSRLCSNNLIFVRLIHRAAIWYFPQKEIVKFATFPLMCTTFLYRVVNKACNVPLRVRLSTDIPQHFKFFCRQFFFVAVVVVVVVFIFAINLGRS